MRRTCSASPTEWAKLAKAAGMKYIVFTTRHHDEFCTFDSHFTDFKVTNTPYRKDTLKMLVEAFRAEGLRVNCNSEGGIEPGDVVKIVLK